MLSALIEDENLVEPLDIQQAYVHFSDEVMDLQVVEKFLGAVELRYLQEPGKPFDPTRIRSNLRILEGFGSELHKEKFNRLTNEVRHGIKNWISALSARDRTIGPFHIRQYCDDPAHRIEPIVYSALTRFYREVEPTPDCQSKFDVAITRLFSRCPEPPFREMLIEREDLVDQIAALFEGWDFGENKSVKAGHPALVTAKLDDFQREALGLADYSDLLSSDLFDRLRTFKRKLGSLYFHPEIAAAAVDCNIAVGNTFNRLLSQANEAVTQKFGEGRDLAGAFYDSSPDAEQHVRSILSELRQELGEENGTFESDTATLEEMVGLVCEGAHQQKSVSRAANGNRTNSTNPDGSEPALPTAQKRLEKVFFALSQPEPDLTSIRRHAEQFGAMAGIDLKDFIGDPSDPNDHLCRNVFGVLLWIEELCESELNAPGEMSKKLKEELHRLLRKSEEFSEQLDYLVRENTAQAQNRLLIVSNRLLESRLKLKRGIARFTRKNLEAAVVQPVSETERLETVQRKPGRVRGFWSGSMNRWLAAATVLVCLASAGIYYFDQVMSRSLPVARDVELLDVSRLPMGSHLKQGLSKDGIMMLTAKQSWARLSAEEQKKNLEDLLEFPTKTKVSAVMITDEMGRVLGNGTKEGTKILGKVQVADSGADTEKKENSEDPKASEETSNRESLQTP